MDKTKGLMIYLKQGLNFKAKTTIKEPIYMSVEQSTLITALTFRSNSPSIDVQCSISVVHMTAITVLPTSD
jgi:hypothetical protein